METMLIELRNEKAVRLLHELEELQIIKVLKKNPHSHGKLSDRYAGALPGDVADDMQNFVNESRTEWNNKAI